MLPELEYNQSVFIEITNPIHGGPGWDFGTCLWSPVQDKGGRNRWQILGDVKQNDFVIHLLKDPDYKWVGISKVESKVKSLKSSPPNPTDWADMAPYQRIDLYQYNPLSESAYVNNIFNSYTERLVEEYKKDKSQFYTLYGEEKELRIQQRYLAPCNNEIYAIFNEVSKSISFSPSFSENIIHVPTVNEPSYADYSAPSRKDVNVSRIIRDTKLSRKVKETYNWKCQICGMQIVLPTYDFYAEAHHLIPLGGNYNGPDVLGNLIILCPNHHTEFDYGSIAINPKTMLIEHTDKRNIFHNKNLNYSRKDLDLSSLKYHYENIFKK